MFKTKKSVQFWKIEKYDCIEQIKPLLMADYTRLEEEINLVHRWIPNNGDEVCTNFSEFYYEVNNIKAKYLPVTAHIETLRDREIIPFIPKNIATLPSDSSVMFVEFFGSLFAIVSASSSYYSKIRSNLFYLRLQGSNLKKPENLWGSIDFKGPPLDSTFFYWLLNKKGNKIKIDSNTYWITDVTGFESATDRRRHTYSGRGSSIDTETPVQVMVVNKNEFSGLDLVLMNNECNLYFTLKNGWETIINFTQSNKIIGDTVDFYKPIELVLKIYLEIIPGLIANFNSEPDWSIKEKEYRKNLGNKAINQIMSEIGINKDQIV